MCGYPAAGKTRRAAEIAAALEARGKTVHIVSETPLGIDRREGYLVAASEKRTRGALKSEVERLLNGQEVVILDSLNYIKGFRYELHCTTRLQKTPLCVVHVATSQAQCMEWHQMVGSPYGDDLVTEMFARFECPDSRNRWDKPLFTLEPTEDLPEEDIYAALFEQKQMKPTQATQSQPLSETNFLHELDRVTQEVVKVSSCTEGVHFLLANLSFTPANPADITSVNAANIIGNSDSCGHSTAPLQEIVQALSTAVPGDKIAVSGTEERVTLSRMRSVAELRRIKRQVRETIFTKMAAYSLSLSLSHPLSPISLCLCSRWFLTPRRRFSLLITPSL